MMTYILAATKREADAVRHAKALRQAHTEWVNSPKRLRGVKGTKLIIVNGWQKTRCKLQQAVLNAEILIYKLRNEVEHHDQ